MKIIKGRYNEIKVYTDVIDQNATDQLQRISDSVIFKDAIIRVMPDVHAGKGCTIGTTLTIHDKVIPNMVGVDIGCGMHLVRLKEKELDLVKLDQIINEFIPAGFKIRTEPHPYSKKIKVHKLRCLEHITEDRAYKSVGTLGGGNHFIEVDKDEDNNLYLVIHSGSRHLGTEVSSYYQNLAYQNQKAKNENIINEEDFAYLEGSSFNDYIHDMKITQKFASINRKAMAEVIIDKMDLHPVDSFETIHNYIDTKHMILRKGAVSARKKERILIPINMRDGSLICIGKGNKDWNQSAPHGAGRILSRHDALKNLSLEEYQRTMEGIYSTSVTRKTLDESPMAYKSKEDIIDNILPSVDIIKSITPIYNFKAKD